jgi:hypothetical protein
MSTNVYPFPVNQLLSLGQPKSQEWLDYRALGISEANIPALIRMISDDDLHFAPTDSPLVWAPLHAWRALGQLRAVEAIGALLGLLQRSDELDDDWILDDFPKLFALLGAPAINLLSKFLQNESHEQSARNCAVECLLEVALQTPTLRPRCIRALSQQLDAFMQNDETLNGFLIYALVGLDSRGASLTMQRAFEADRVDTMVTGGWEDVKQELGL